MLTHIGFMGKTKLNILYPVCKFNTYSLKRLLSLALFVQIQAVLVTAKQTKNRLCESALDSCLFKVQVQQKQNLNLNILFGSCPK